MALIGGTIPVQGEDGLMDADDSMDVMEVPGVGLTTRSNNPHHASITTQEHVGELGNMLLACDHTSIPILNTILRYMCIVRYLLSNRF